MRIIGHLEHPRLKITVFKMDNRISIKFENELYEQTYKLGLDERLESLADVQKLVDPAFTAQVLAQFQEMHRIRMEGYSRAFPLPEQFEFEEII